MVKYLRPAMKSLEAELFIAGLQSFIANRKNFQHTSQKYTISHHYTELITTAGYSPITQHNSMTDSMMLLYTVLFHLQIYMRRTYAIIRYGQDAMISLGRDTIICRGSV